MKTALHITLIVIAVTVVIYLGSAFISFSFDLSTYDRDSRLMMFLWWISVSMIGSAIYFIERKI
jgi:hypothetical protein